MCPVRRLLLHLVGILFPRNNDDARSKSLQTSEVFVNQLATQVMWCVLVQVNTLKMHG